MQVLTILLIISATTFEFLVEIGWLPGPAKYVVELLGAIVLLYVATAGSLNRFRYVRSAYWIVFGAILVDMICGVLANHVEPGPLFTGTRSYIRAIPLFFLPAVLKVSGRQIRTQLWLLLVIAVLQLPLAAYQRMTQLARGGITGDTTTGTLMLSNFLSIFLICGMAVVMGLYLRKLISVKWVVVLCLLLLIPTTINETKGTLVLLPIALGTVFLVGAKPGARLKNSLLAAMFLCVCGAVFIPIYDALIVVRPYPTTISEFLTKPGRLQEYLSKRDAEVGTTEKVGRLDAMVVPLGVIAKDPAQLMFGLGLGNASKSSLGPRFTGRYNYLLEPFLMSTFSVVVSELGVLGLCLLVGLYWLIFVDCRAVALSASPLMSGIALGWAGVTAVMLICLPYTNMIPSPALSYLFWYFSGLIAAERMRLVYASAEGLVEVRR
jgi:hypothetical protein